MSDFMSGPELDPYRNTKTDVALDEIRRHLAWHEEEERSAAIEVVGAPESSEPDRYLSNIASLTRKARKLTEGHPLTTEDEGRMVLEITECFLILMHVVGEHSLRVEGRCSNPSCALYRIERLDA